MWSPTGRPPILSRGQPDSRDRPTSGARPPPTEPPTAAGRQEPPPFLSGQRLGQRTALIAGVAALTVVMIFIIQNTHAVNISFLGAHPHLSLAVALLLAAMAGALAMAAAGTARITQLRRIMRRNRRDPQAG